MCDIATVSKGPTSRARAAALSPVAFARMSRERPTVVLDVAQLQALLAKTFNVGLDVGRGKEPVALVRLRLAKALIGVAEANALAAEAIAIEWGVGTEQIAQAEALALHAAAFNGMPDPVFHLAARAMAIVTGLAAIEPDPRAGDNDVLLDAALQAATGRGTTAVRRGQSAVPMGRGSRMAGAAAALPRRLRHRQSPAGQESGHRTPAERRGRADESRRGGVWAAGACQGQRRGGAHGTPT